MELNFEAPPPKKRRETTTLGDSVSLRPSVPVPEGPAGNPSEQRQVVFGERHGKMTNAW